MPRYYIADDCHTLVSRDFKSEIRIAEASLWRGEKRFCDIIDWNDGWYTVKVFMPDGSMLIGLTREEWLKIHYNGEVFDGRFNSDRVNDVPNTQDG